MFCNIISNIRCQLLKCSGSCWRLLHAVFTAVDSVQLLHILHVCQGILLMLLLMVVLLLLMDL